MKIYTDGRKVYNPGRKGLHGAGGSKGGKVYMDRREVYTDGRKVHIYGWKEGI